MIAPLSANSMGKIVNGISDNLVTLVGGCGDMALRKSGGTVGGKEEEVTPKLVKPFMMAHRVPVASCVRLMNTCISTWIKPRIIWQLYKKKPFMVKRKRTWRM